MGLTDRFLRTGIAVVVATSLVACATPKVPRQDMAPSTAAHIKRLAILGVAEPEGLSAPLDMGAGTGAAFGIFGPLGLIALVGVMSQRMKSRNAEFSAAVATEKGSYAAQLTEALVRDLSSRDLEVQTLSQQHPKPIDGGRYDYSGIPADVDAWLHVRILSMGYANDPSGGVSAPFLSANAQLIQPRTGDKLFERLIIVHPFRRELDGLDSVSGPTQPQFPNYEALMTSTKLAGEALRESIKVLAVRIVEALSLPPKVGVAPESGPPPKRAELPPA